jgi:hypothetical protein
LILLLCYGSFSLVSLSSDNLNVLRVLSEQTLEINKEVKDSFVIDPRLVKVVKDSTLTILVLFNIGFKSIVFEARHKFDVFLCRTRAHCA